MKKFSFFLNCAATALFAIALTACQDVKDNPSGNDNPAKQTIEIKNGDELATIINQMAATAGDEIIVELPSGINVVTGKITTPNGKKVTIVGNGTQTIKATDPIIVSNAIAVKNVAINAAAVDWGLFQYNTTPDPDLLNTVKPGNTNNFYNIQGEAFLLENVVIDSLNVRLVYDNKVKINPEQLIIDNCIIKMTTPKQVNAMIDFQTGGVKTFKIQNSTIYGVGANSVKYVMYAGSNAQLAKFGYDTATDSMSVQLLNNTFYNPCSNYFGNYSGFQNYTKYLVLNNIFYNMKNNGNTGQIAQRICANRFGTKSSAVFNDNLYMNDGVLLDQGTNFDKGNKITIDPGFSMPSRGLFHPTNKSFPTTVGDLRWFEDAAKWQ